MQLGMIGLGRMGANMVRRLVKGGHQYVVFDMSANAVADLVKDKATGSSSLAPVRRCWPSTCNTANDTSRGPVGCSTWAAAPAGSYSPSPGAAFPCAASICRKKCSRVAGEKAVAAGVAIDRVQANLVALDFLADASFDYAACLFSTLGMVAGADQRRRVLTHVRRVLRPGAVLVLHVHNYWFNLWDRGGRRWAAARPARRPPRRRGGPADAAAPGHRGPGAASFHAARGRRSAEGGGLLAGGSAADRPRGRRRPARWPALLGGLRAYGYFLTAR